MRTIIFLCALILPLAARAQDKPLAGSLPPELRSPPGPPRGGPGGGGPGGRLFISPMGEPFRSVRGGPEPQDLWLAGADANHDNALSRAEFRADAMRFFAVLDRQRDGEIDPEDIEHYETVMAPEIRVPNGGYEPPPSEDNSSSRPVYPDRQGAARYGYFSFPEPVMSADTNYNRGVSVAEFVRAADTRFDILDANGDGRIDRDELPRIDPPRLGVGPRGGGERGDRSVFRGGSEQSRRGGAGRPGGGYGGEGQEP